MVQGCRRLTVFRCYYKEGLALSGKGHFEGHCEKPANTDYMICLPSSAGVDPFAQRGDVSFKLHHAKTKLHCKVDYLLIIYQFTVGVSGTNNCFYV